MGKPRREERKVCCVCGRRKSKTWNQHKGCNACSGHCLSFLEEQAVGICAFHKQAG
jgi:hypothetical protein